MDLLGLKALLVVVLFLTCLFFGLLPVRILKCVTASRSQSFHERAKQCMSLLSCYGGGVFLATCLLDLLPTVRDKLSQAFDSMMINTAYPIAEFVIACGFFIIVIVEQTALDCKEKSDMAVKSKELRIHTTREYDEPNRPLIEDSDSHIRFHDAENGDYGSIARECDRRLASNQHSMSGDHTASEHDSHDMHSHSSLRSLLLLLALSLHSVFEGLAIGLQTDRDQLLAIFSAVVIHKNILAFSLGMTLIQSRLSRCSILMSCLCFAIMAPLGAMLGIILIDSISNFSHSVVNGILQGFATGTFLYITFFEVLPHEMNSSKDRLLKVLFLLLGFSTIAAVLFLEPTVIRPTCYQGAQPVG
ncbi:zinc transporter ZIP1-like [Diadema antillarum]|uniref:zinc transporter ZIP1-like n=1 Tax=Diadema antillarum TaxID=105358 RepID=UPI003A86481B